MVTRRTADAEGDGEPVARLALMPNRLVLTWADLASLGPWLGFWNIESRADSACGFVDRAADGGAVDEPPPHATSVKAARLPKAPSEVRSASALRYICTIIATVVRGSCRQGRCVRLGHCSTVDCYRGGDR
jgi:hypothetical protein